MARYNSRMERLGKRELYLNSEKKETLRRRKIGVAIGSGGIYSAAGLGVIQRLEAEGLNVPFAGGASGGAIMAALYYLEGKAGLAQAKLLEKLSEMEGLKFELWRSISGEEIRGLIAAFLDGRDWQDGKIEGACFGAAYLDTKEPVILTEDSGLSLIDCVLASVSLKTIKPVVRLNGRLITHGGDPSFIRGIKALGADFLIEVSPNLESGVSGRLAGAVNTFTIMLAGGCSAVRRFKSERQREGVDMEVHPDVSLKPFISPLNFSVRSAEYMMEEGRRLADEFLKSGGGIKPL